MQIRKVTNLVSPLLKAYRYKKKPDPFAEFKGMRAGETFPESTNGNILLLPIRVSPTSNIFEGLIGYAMKLRGYTPHALMCGQNVSRCDNVNQRGHFDLSCSLCLYEQNRFSDCFGINAFTYSGVVDRGRIADLRLLSERVALAEIFSYTYNGVGIGKHVEGGVARFLLQSNIGLQEHERLIRDYLFTSLLTVEATRSVLARLKPKFVLSSHGIYSTWGAALETCLADGYPTVIWGRGYIGQGNILAAHDASYLAAIVHEKADPWEHVAVDGASKDKLDRYFLGKRTPGAGTDHVNYYDNIETDKSDVIGKLNLKKDRPRIGVYPNIPWDGKTFSSTPGFPDLNVFVRAIVEWASAHEDVDVIIRAHPAEAHSMKKGNLETFYDILRLECPVLPANVIFVEPTSSVTSYRLSTICNAALMYSSTLALEFAYDRHPVIQVGLNSVSNKGLLFEAATKEELFSLLDAAVRGELVVSEQRHERMVRYADYWVNRRHFPESMLELKSLSFEKYKFKASMDLAPGGNEVLDWFIGCCLNKKDFVWNKDRACT